MAKMVMDFPMNLEKINPKSGPLRRSSTGNELIKISEPKPIPNYLRASIGSCHDFCKYGTKRDFLAEPIDQKQDKIKDVVLETGSQTNYRGKKFSGTRNSAPEPSRQQPSELKMKPLVRSDQSAMKQSDKTLLKTTKNDVQISRNDSGKGIRSVPHTSSTFSGSSVKIRRSKSSPKEDSRLEIKKSVENSETCKKTSYENVPEKIIHVIEPNDENRNEDLALDGKRCMELCSSPNQKQEMDSAAKSRRRGIRIGKFVPKENDSAPRKLQMKKGKALEIKNGDLGSKDIRLRRAVSDGKIIQKKNVSVRDALHHKAVEAKTTNPNLMNASIEETSSKLASKSMVKALVDAFETLINIRDSKSSTTYRRSV